VENVRVAAARLRECDPEVEAVYLFGSLARGRALPGSDADVLILLTHPQTPFLDRIANYSPHFDDVGLPVDVFPYSSGQTDHPYVRAALEGGIRLA
jgi:predicted nucleotidyltransferase